MPTTPATYTYYPALSDLMKPADLPDFLSFIKDGLQAVFDKMYYKDYQTSRSTTGSSAFYSLDIVSRKKLALELPGTGVFFVLNPDYNDSTISSFPVTVFWEWEVMRYVRYFNLNGFSFSPEDFYHLALQILNISEEQVIELAINTFVVQSNPALSKFGQLVQDINTLYSAAIAIEESSQNKLQELIVQVNLLDKKIAPAVFSLYLLTTDLNTTKEKIKTFFSSFIPDDFEAYIKKIITPKARLTLELTAAIEFPRKILVPWKNNGSERDEDETKIARFKFAKALLYADTQAGIGYNLELAGTLDPPFCEIGKSGILIQIESLKLDLSKTSNIPEADADGRPNDFTGIYARALSVTLPARWFQDEALQGTPATTLRIGGYDLLIGTGGVSGTFVLEAVPSIIAGGTTYYFDDKFTLDYPVVLLQKNVQTEVVEEVKVENIGDLKSKLFPAPTPTSAKIPLYSFKFPLNLTETVGGAKKTFKSATEYQLYLTSFASVDPIDQVPTLWKTIGSSKGFRVGFNKFDITFKQNKVISSNIKGALEIKKFVYPENTPNAGKTVHIDIEGHIHDNGDFNLTASAQPPYPIRLPKVFTYNLKSVELGKEGDDYYIGTAGSIEFEGILKDVLHLKAIEIERLRIYSDGSIEIKGGSIQLAKPIVLPLGPVQITVSAIHLGSHQKEYDGVMRKFNYFGFDGGISVNPLGIEIRGDGVKFYYCVDNLPNKPDSYLHIQTLYLDLTIPSKTPVAIIKGWLSIPEPGTSPEYAGGIKIDLPKAKITGSADMKLQPKYPAFIIDAELEFPVPIPLGPIGIYGFRGLLGYRYVAEKEAVGLVSGKDSWYDYYKFPKRGINVRKFNGPNKTKRSGTPVAIGAGASIGTSFDNGTVVNIKAFVLLSIPSLFLIDGRAAIISARLGLDDSGDPPFFAFVAVGDNSIEFGFGADFKLPQSSGSILKIYADVQAGFFFKDSSKWYVNVGTRVNPIRAEILSLLTIQSYVMLSAKGIEAGARGEFNFERDYGIIKVHAWAYIEIGGRISFERPQLGAYLKAGVGADIDVKFLSLFVAVDIMFGVEVPKPFLIYGEFYFTVRIKILWVFSFSFSGNLKVEWRITDEVDITPVNPLINAAVIEIPGAIAELVKGVNMLSNETFELAYLGAAVPTVLIDEIKNKIIPLDTYIDIKTEKGLLPGGIAELIGGYNNAPSRHFDLVPPDNNIQGRNIRQVKHEYAIEKIEIKSWDPSTNQWLPYHPYKALYPNDNGVLDHLKIGQFQKTDGQYNAVRLLATTPFSYTEQGQPGWHIPEQYGITATTLFCESQKIERKCATFTKKPLGQKYYCYNANQNFVSDDVSFLLLRRNSGDFAVVEKVNNSFNLKQSLSFKENNILQLILPKPSVEVDLRLSSPVQGLKIKYYAVIGHSGRQVQYGNPDPYAVHFDEPYEKIVNPNQLNVAIQYNHPDWKPVVKITIEALHPNFISLQIGILQQQIADIKNHNNLVLLGITPGPIQATDILEAQLHDLLCGKGEVKTEVYRLDYEDNLYSILINGTEQNTISGSWNFDTDSKNPNHEFGFSLGDGMFKVESDHEILEVRLPIETNSFDNHGNPMIVPPPRYKVVYSGKSAKVYIDEADFFNYYDSTSDHDIEVTFYKSNDDCKPKTPMALPTNPKNTKDKNAEVAQKTCVKNKFICDKYEELKTVYNQFVSIAVPTTSAGYQNYGPTQARFSYVINPVVNLITTPEAIAHYANTSLQAYNQEDVAVVSNAMNQLLSYFYNLGNCDCVPVVTNTNEAICKLQAQIKAIFNSGCFTDPKVIPCADFNGTQSFTCAQQIAGLITTFTSGNPIIDANFQLQLSYLNQFIAMPTFANYLNAWHAIQAIIDYLYAVGNCKCMCDENPNPISNITFHEVCWLSVEDHQYNINIPSQAAITADTQATVDGINTYIQPIWRPDTNYYVHFVLSDIVNGTPNYFPYTYGFTTAGPVGYFHTHEKATYGNIVLAKDQIIDTANGSIVIPAAAVGKVLEDTNGIIRNADGSIYKIPDPKDPQKTINLTPHPDKYPLTMLRQYIDYARSYPNADGNLLSAKPLFYDDKTTQIYVFFNKAYTSHFFKKWQRYNGKKEVEGRLKIVIKDPREDVAIINPPYLDFDPKDTIHVNIPQTVEEWVIDDNPQLPHQLSQYNNLLAGSHCTGIITTIKPASQFIKVFPKHLKPSKLYTAIVNNVYDLSGDGTIDSPADITANKPLETREVHKFVFQTSRYANFVEQVNSYKLKSIIEGETAEKDAIFHIEKAFTALEIDAAYNTIVAQPVTGMPTAVLDNLNNNYQHPFDRVFEGILGFSPINEAISTEFNIIKNTATNTVIAVLVRNPEPFNNPKIPLDSIQNTLQVVTGNIPDSGYKVLFSKDYSQAIIMHDSKEIIKDLALQFKYKIWDGDKYIVPAEEDVLHPKYTLLVTLSI
jgi:hypothetical protein